jgi:DnaB-like helicase C terminal domain
LKVALAFKTHNWGRLFIKKMPEAGTNANMIRAYLKEYEITNGFKPDAILVDYLDLLHPNSGKVSPSDLFVKDKYTSEELRALAAEYNVLAATASQLNRASIQEQSFDASHMAGGISKINTADNVMGIYMSPQMKEIGQYQIQFLKTRSSSGVGSHVFLKFSPETLRITDHDDNQNLHVPTQFSKIQQELKNNVQTTVGSSPAKSGPNIEADEYKPGAAKTAAGSGSILRDKLTKMKKEF